MYSRKDVPYRNFMYVPYNMYVYLCLCSFCLFLRLPSSSCQRDALCWRGHLHHTCFVPQQDWAGCTSFTIWPTRRQQSSSRVIWIGNHVGETLPNRMLHTYFSMLHTYFCMPTLFMYVAYFYLKFIELSNLLKRYTVLCIVYTRHRIVVTMSLTVHLPIGPGFLHVSFGFLPGWRWVRRYPSIGTLLLSISAFIHMYLYVILYYPDGHTMSYRFSVSTILKTSTSIHVYLYVILYFFGDRTSFSIYRVIIVYGHPLFSRWPYCI